MKHDEREREKTIDKTKVTNNIHIINIKNLIC